MMSAAYQAQPEKPGSMHRVITSGQRSLLIEEYIFKELQHIIGEVKFKRWKIEWDKATEDGMNGKEWDILG